MIGNTQLNVVSVVVGRRQWVCDYATQNECGPNHLLEECSHETAHHHKEYNFELPDPSNKKVMEGTSSKEVT